MTNESGLEFEEPMLRAAVETLRRHNAWRRGADIPMEYPNKLGVAIDLIINHLDKNMED